MSPISSAGGKKQRKVSNKLDTTSSNLFQDGPIAFSRKRPLLLPNGEGDVSLSIACKLLNNDCTSSSHVNTSNNNKNDDSLCFTSVSQNLLSTLQSSTNMKTQLGSLQLYRSTLLHPSFLFNNNFMEDEHQELTIMQGMLRILLEVAWSHGISCAIKRASITCIDAILTIKSQPTNDWVSMVYISVLTSILSSSSNNNWRNPITTLFDAMAYVPTQQILIHNETLLLQAFTMLDEFVHNENNSTSVTTVLQTYSFSALQQENKNIHNIIQVSDAVEQAIQVTTTLRAILTPLLLSSSLRKKMEHQDPILHVLQTLEGSPLTTLIQCRATPSDTLSIVGVTLAQIKILQWSISSSVIGTKEMYDHIVALLVAQGPTSTNIPKLNHVALVRGWIAVAPPVLLLSKDTNQGDPPLLLLGPIFHYLLSHVLHDPSASVRLSALRGWDSWISRVLSLLVTSTTTIPYDENEPLGNEYCFYSHDDLVRLVKPMLHPIIDMIMLTWSSPPTRQIAAILPVVFSNLCTLLQHMDTYNDDGGDLFLKKITKRILSQPLNRKGRYEALEILLPYVGAQELLSMEEKKELIISLIQGVGDTGNNSNAIAQLLGKILSRLLQEQQVLVDAVHPTCDTSTMETKLNDPHEVTLLKEGKNIKEPAGFRDWLNFWIHPLAVALLSDNQRRRRQVAAFCLPLIVPISLSNRSHASVAIESLLMELTKLSFSSLTLANLSLGINGSYQSNAGRIGTGDTYFWAVLECAQYASSQKMIESSICLRRYLAKCLPLNQLKALLTHANESLRLAGFLAIEAIVPCYIVDSGDHEVILDTEVAIWTETLMYASKSNDKGYTSKLLACLHKLLRRLQTSEDQRDSGSRLQKFVCTFLIDYIALQKGLYPGTVAEKEFFALSLVRSIVAFASGLHAEIGVKSLSKRNTQSDKLATEATCILHHLVSKLTFFLPIFHSIWDTSRATAFELVRDVVRWALENNIALPESLTDVEQRQALYFRSIHLASSPRQREADTGARMLAVLYISAPNPTSARASFFKNLLSLLIERLDNAEMTLSAILNSDCSKETLESGSGDNSFLFPLAHGLLHATSIVVEQAKESAFAMSIEKGEKEILYQQLCLLCGRAITISLAVVSDLDCADDDQDVSDNATPLNVNSGALGANTSFSFLHEVSQKENDRRMIEQRIVIGSWLLTKEACGALTTAITGSFSLPKDIVEAIGELLISTLISLKHQGGAFAAHKALQQLSESCYLKTSQNPEMQSLPHTWICRLFTEISETVKNSTLRRSTGYALGFLSILRTEPSPRCSLCSFAVTSLLRMSLPPESAMDRAGRRLGINFEFAYANKSEDITLLSFVSDSMYEVKSRLHALNILRLFILDAPLSKDTKVYIGDTIIAGLIGYDDNDWAIRNSSTMVFAAAMLRVIDADKNAAKLSKIDLNKKQGNAVTARELFRSYPPLGPFLAAILRQGLVSLNDENNHCPSKTIHPSLFPALLLLARLQPAEMTIDEEGEAEILVPFLKLLLGCLQHWHRKVRCMAGRALARFCSGDNSLSPDSSREVLLSSCMIILQESTFATHVTASWNKCHGALVGIRELLVSASDPIKYFDAEALKTMYFYASWSNGSGKFPPSCAAVALEILSFLNDEVVLDRAAFTALEKTVLLNSLRRKPVIGLEELSVIATKFLIQRSRHIIFSVQTCDEERSLHMTRLKCAILSPSFDTRCSAIKTFKKDLCTDVQRFYCECKNDANAVIVFEAVASLLNLAMRSEIARFESESIGPHPPNLRRLTKCLLEVVTVYPLEESLNYWQLLQDLTKLGNLSPPNLRVDQHEVIKKRCNPLAAVAVQLMSFYIKGTPALFGDRGESCAMFVEQFVDAVGVLVHPHNEFDVRYRATRAIQASQIFRLQQESSIADPSAIEAIEKCCLTLFQHTVTLLQDSDEDIRSLASVALSDAFAPQDLRTGVSFVSLLSLERSFAKYCKRSYNSVFVNTMMAQILENCEDPEQNIDLVLHEFAYTENANHTSLNLSTDRKIFEEEEANPFKERLVLIQLAATACVRSECKRGDAHLARIIYQRCKLMLSILKRRLGCCFAYELTNCYLAFPSCQGFLLGGICLVYSGADKLSGVADVDATSITDDAKALLLLIKANHRIHSPIHPWVLKTLDVLANSSLGEDSTREGLLKCCFLLNDSSA